jgi:hypothetical protein
LNQWLTLIANLGVIAGIVFLAYEIQVNTSAVQSANFAAYNEVTSSWADLAAEHAAVLAEVGQHTSLSELTPEQLWVFAGGLAVKTFHQAHTAFLYHRAGSLPDDVFEAAMAGIQHQLELEPLLKETWRNQRHHHVREFNDLMERRVPGLRRADG